eukprot:5011179-Pyramimonas_sp.AAC.1
MIPLAQKALNTRGTQDISEMEDWMAQFSTCESRARAGGDMAPPRPLLLHIQSRRVPPGRHGRNRWA